MVAEALDITRETYLAFLMDREHNGPVMVGSPFGGMDIEEVAEKTPEAIFTVSVKMRTKMVFLSFWHPIRLVLSGGGGEERKFTTDNMLG